MRSPILPRWDSYNQYRAEVGGLEWVVVVVLVGVDDDVVVVLWPWYYWQERAQDEKE